MMNTYDDDLDCANAFLNKMKSSDTSVYINGVPTLTQEETVRVICKHVNSLHFIVKLNKVTEDYKILSREYYIREYTDNDVFVFREPSIKKLLDSLDSDNIVVFTTSENGRQYVKVSKIFDRYTVFIQLRVCSSYISANGMAQICVGV